jgi:hypothetical protein
MKALTTPVRVWLNTLELQAMQCQITGVTVLGHYGSKSALIDRNGWLCLIGQQPNRATMMALFIGAAGLKRGWYTDWFSPKSPDSAQIFNGQAARAYLNELSKTAGPISADDWQALTCLKREKRRGYIEDGSDLPPGKVKIVSPQRFEQARLLFDAHSILRPRCKYSSIVGVGQVDHGSRLSERMLFVSRRAWVSVSRTATAAEKMQTWEWLLPAYKASALAHVPEATKIGILDALTDQSRPVEARLVADLTEAVERNRMIIGVTGEPWTK